LGDNLGDNLGDDLGDSLGDTIPSIIWVSIWAIIWATQRMIERRYWMHPNIEQTLNSQICLYMFPIEGLVVIKVGAIIHEDSCGGFRLILFRSNQETSMHDMFTSANV